MKWLVIVFTLCVAGCSAANHEPPGPETDASIATKLVRGETTKAQVQGVYGTAHATSFTASGNEQWTYALNVSESASPRYFPYLQVVSLPDPGRPKTLSVVFDKAGRVANYSLSDAAAAAAPAQPPH